MISWAFCRAQWVAFGTRRTTVLGRLSSGVTSLGRDVLVLGAATRTQAMLTARAKDGDDKRQRALAAIQALEAAGTPVTATAVATTGVSTWLVYADGVNEHVQAARSRQAERKPGADTEAPPARREPVTQASLRTELAVARDEIRRLSVEWDKLRARLRLQLGAEIEGLRIPRRRPGLDP